MNRKPSLLITVITFFGILSAAAYLYAGTTVLDVIKMDNKAYTTHKKGIVSFSHKKHFTDYAAKSPDLFKNGCGTCHHDKDHKPLLNLKEGDDVQACIECHKKPGEPPRTKADEPKLTDKEKLEYQAQALHENCRGCHKAYNEASGTKDAPTTCTKCHPKKS